MFATDQPRIEAYAAVSPEHTYAVYRFVVATAGQRFALVPRVLAHSQWFSQRQRDGLDLVYAGRRLVYRTVMAKRHDPVDLMTYLVSLPNLGVPKAGFLAQLLTGTVGCMDVHNLRDPLIHRLLRGTPVPKTLVRIDGCTDATIARRLCQYCGLCAFLGTAFLWDNWCATLASKYTPGQALYPWRTAQDVSTFHLTCLGIA